jgi:4'-phosphopantetheinyl transferase
MGINMPVTDLLNPALIPGHCHVWWSRPGDADARLGTLLDATERERLRTLRREIDRNRFTVGCALVRLALAAYLSQPPARIALSRTCARCGLPHGKPHLAHGGRVSIEFSVSHAADRIVAAFALGTPVGVDVERVDPKLPLGELMRLVLTQEEADVLCRGEREQQVRDFFIYWTRKEAVVKATGLGFAVPPASFAVTGPDEPPRLLSWPRRSDLVTKMSLTDLDAGCGYAASLAVAGCHSHVVSRDGSALIGRWLNQHA